jgi:ribosomal protein L11 methyltransferase
MISSDLKSKLKEDGILILSGILDKYEGRVKSSFSDLKVLKVVQKNEWITLILQNSKEI